MTSHDERAVSDVFADRRARVLSTLGGDGALVLAAAPELIVGSDTEVRYVPAADLYYLTGYAEPEAVAVLCPSHEHSFTMFVRPRDPERERWTGVRGGAASAMERFGAAAAYPLAELSDRLSQLIAGADRVFASLDTHRAEVDAALRHALSRARRTRARSGRGVHTITDPHVLLAPMRVRKDDVELDAIRAAADISVRAFEDVARDLMTARHEYEVEARVEYGFRSRGALGPAFPTIAAAGANATVLHYTANSAPLRKGDLLLIDAGARADMYCADITRTFPVSGRFTARQRALHDVVHAAHDAAVACIAPGRSVADMEDAALRILVQGMIDLRLLEGALDDIIGNGTYRQYFPHRVSHWLGLDVHDVGDYAVAGEPVMLEAGMVLTVEPGLYIPADDDDAPADLRGTGIRLENDVLVTASGVEVLTGALPIAAADIEAMIAG